MLVNHVVFLPATVCDCHHKNYNKKLRERGQNSASVIVGNLPVSANSDDSTQLDYKRIIQLFRDNFAIKTTGVWKQQRKNIYS